MTNYDRTFLGEREKAKEYCRIALKRWLDQEYKSPFHVGDVVICGKYSYIGFVINVEEDEVIVSPYKSDINPATVKFITQRYNIDEVHLYDDKDGD